MTDPFAPESSEVPKSRVFRTAVLGFGLTMVVLVAGGIAGYLSARRVQDDQDQVRSTHSVILGLEQLLSTVKDAETGQRGYLLTGDPAYLAPYHAALDSIRLVEGRLFQVLSADSEARAPFATLNKLIDRKLFELGSTIALTDRGERPAALDIVRSDSGKRMMDSARAVVMTLADREQALRQRLADETNSDGNVVRYCIVITVVVALLMILLILYLLRRSAVSDAHSRGMLAAHKELMRVTLFSIGDGVISTDIEGRVTNLNPVAEELCGWSVTDAKGQPLTKVFNIVNEQTRNVVENPAVRSLRDGVIVGLANHTILISRNGGERPIEDSAAPIRTPGGEMLGCVLVFRDATQNRLAEAALRAQLSETMKFRTLFDQSSVFSGIMDIDGTLLDANRLSLEGCGFVRTDAIGRKFWDGPWWSASESLRKQVRDAVGIAALGEVFRDELPYRVGDGSDRIVDLTVLPVRDEAGEVMFLVPTGLDITARKEAESDRQKLVSLAENSTDFIGMCNEEFVPVYVNRAGLAVTGLESLDDARSRSIKDFFFPEDQARIMHDFYPQVVQDGNGEVEVRFRHFRTGEPIWMLYRVFGLYTPSGERDGFATVSRDISDRKRMESDLRQLAADLSESGRRKDEFLATLAHELRNPLAPIRNGLRILRLAMSTSGVTDPVIEQTRAMMERQLAQLVRLVDDLLDVSRISRGKQELQVERVDLGVILHNAIETSRPLVDQRNHRLIEAVPAEPIPIDADATRLEQVFTNLIQNAAKYSDAGADIRLTVVLEEKQAIVTVQDNGIGISPETLPRIFDLFMQVDHTLDRSEGGLGIGLTLVKRLVEMHGGRVEARSSGEGKGSEFVVWLPIAPAPAEVTGGDLRPVARPQSVRALRVLIADDNVDAASTLGSLLRILGHQIQIGHDGAAALALAESFRPELILLDIGMPMLNGYEVCRRIRQEPWGRTMRVVALTGWGQDRDKDQSAAAGFDQHIVKPIDPAVLEELLATVT